MEEGTKEEIQKLKDLRVQINSVKKELNKLNREKETWFKKRSTVNKKITELIGGVKGSKDERNELTGKVKDLKEERDTLNKEISEKVTKLKELKEKTGDAPVGRGSRDRKDPVQIKKQIEKIDYTIQTEPMSFKKEQQLMGQLKTLKKELAELSDVADEWKSVSQLQREISKLRKKSNVAHREIQKQATDSQSKHETVIETSKEIDGLKEEEKEAYDKFKEYKQLFTDKNNELKELLKEADELKEVLEAKNVEVEEDKKRVEAQEVKKKAKEVNEKIKTGGKLTTEDLLIFQKAMNK